MYVFVLPFGVINDDRLLATLRMIVEVWYRIAMKNPGSREPNDPRE